MSAEPTDVVMLTTDAFGGHGGIAKYNRDFITALSTFDSIRNVVVLPRIVPGDPGAVPDKVEFVTDGVGGRVQYVRAVARLALQRDRRVGLVVCGHIHLLSLAIAVARRYDAPLSLLAYGIEVWQKPKSPLVRHLLRNVDSIISISDVTLARFRNWAPIKRTHAHILPNAVDLTGLTPGPKAADLVKEFGLEGKKVLMTFGRLESRERYKGFDEVIEVLPRLLAKDPSIVYLIAGGGNDRERLVSKVAALGLSHAVRFTGLLPEARKADYLRLADAFVMPSRGEGFGFVLLEAMACGVPAVASTIDGGREALRDGRLGILVDPGDPGDIESGIWSALEQPHGVVPSGLDYFEYGQFEERVHRLVPQLAS